MADRHVQVIAPGAAVAPVAASSAELVVCADGGVAVALAAGRRIDHVVGDLDSVTAADLAVAESHGARLERHPPEKDESDLELAIAASAANGADEVTVHLGAGGRLDHQLANLLVLAAPRWRSLRIDAWVGEDRVWVVHDRRIVPLPVGAHLAVQAVAGPASVTTVGVAYPLTGEVLQPTQARGISNTVLTSPVEVRVDDGIVLVIGSAQSAQA